MSVYPHRLTKFQEQKCDVCRTEISTNFISVPFVTYIGLQYCNNLQCKNIAHSWLIESTISSQVLKEKYGKKFVIERSSGVKETGWTISSAAFKEESNGPYWVKIRDESRKHTKYVPLAVLIDSNHKLI